jgi:hypothetical protein
MPGLECFCSDVGEDAQNGRKTWKLDTPFRFSGEEPQNIQQGMPNFQRNNKKEKTLQNSTFTHFKYQISYISNHISKKTPSF